MSDRRFEMRLTCHYAGDKNDVTGLDVELLNEDTWQPLELGIQSPGFLIFVYSIFHCQHRLFRVKAADRHLLLDSARGSILVVTEEDWVLKTLRVGFAGHLVSGNASEEDIELIVKAMKDCPVSTNLREAGEVVTDINFN